MEMDDSSEYDIDGGLAHADLEDSSFSTSWPYLDMVMNTTLLEIMNGSWNGSNELEMIEMDRSIPVWRQLIWSFFFVILVIVAAVGNVIVIWIVLFHKRMRTVTNYLLVNLSIADTMVSTLNVIPNFIFMVSGNWPFGEFYCKLVQFVAILSICGSVFSLMAIAFERYTAILNPLRPRMGKRITLGIAGAIWVVGSIIGAPYLFFCITYVREISETERQVICFSQWPDGPQTQSKIELWYNVFFMIFTYFVPIGAMCFTYTRVSIELWGSSMIGECTQRQLDNIKSKRRVVKMLIGVVIIAALCWLPFNIYFIWVSLFPEVTEAYFVREVYLGIYWLAMSNSMYNPIVYCYMNARFRRGFQQVFRWCPFVHYSEVENTGVVLHPEMNRRFRADTTRYSVTGSPENDNRGPANGSANVHIPLHVLTSADTKNNSTTHLNSATTHYLAPPGLIYPNGQSQKIRSHNIHNHKQKNGKNSNCSSEFM